MQCFRIRATETATETQKKRASEQKPTSIALGLC